MPAKSKKSGSGGGGSSGQASARQSARAAGNPPDDAANVDPLAASVNSKELPNQLDQAEKDKRLEAVRPFWDALSTEERRNLLRLPLKELKAYATELNVTTQDYGDVNMHDLLRESIDRMSSHSTWKLWRCTLNEDRDAPPTFRTSEEFRNHLTTNHNLKLQPVQSGRPPTAAETALRERMSKLLKTVSSNTRQLDEEVKTRDRNRRIPQEQVTQLARQTTIDNVSTILEDLRDEEQCLFDSCLLPVLRFVNDEIPPADRQSTAKELAFADLELLSQESLERCAEFLLDRVEGYAAELNKPRDADDPDEIEEEIDLFTMEDGSTTMQVHPKWLNHLERRQIGEDGQPYRVENDAECSGLVLDWIYGRIVCTMEKARASAKRTLGNEDLASAAQQAYKGLQRALADQAQHENEKKRARELMATMLEMRKQAAGLPPPPPPQNQQRAAAAAAAAAANGGSPTSAAASNAASGAASPSSDAASSGADASTAAADGSSATSKPPPPQQHADLTDAQMRMLLRREELLTRAKIHVLEHENRVSMAKRAQIAMKIAKGEPEFKRLQQELEEAKRAPRQSEGGTFRNAAELERHRAAMVDAAHEEQVELLDALRDQSQRLQRLVHEQEMLERQEQAGDRECQQLSAWRLSVQRMIQDITNDPSANAASTEAQAQQAALAAAGGDESATAAAAAAAQARKSAAEEREARLERTRRKFHDSIHAQLYSDEDDISFFAKINEQIKDINNKMEVAQAALTHQELLLTNILCVDPGAEVSAHLVLPYLQRKLEMTASEHAAKKAAEAEADVLGLEDLDQKRAKEEKEKNSKKNEAKKRKQKEEKEARRLKEEEEKRRKEEEQRVRAEEQKREEEEARRRRAEELEARRAAEEKMLEQRRQELLSEENGHWRRRIEEAEREEAAAAAAVAAVAAAVEAEEASDSAPAPAAASEAPADGEARKRSRKARARSKRQGGKDDDMPNGEGAVAAAPAVADGDGSADGKPLVRRMSSSSSMDAMDNAAVKAAPAPAAELGIDSARATAAALAPAPSNPDAPAPAAPASAASAAPPPPKDAPAPAAPAPAPASATTSRLNVTAAAFVPAARAPPPLGPPGVGMPAMPPPPGAGPPRPGMPPGVPGMPPPPPGVAPPPPHGVVPPGAMPAGGMMPPGAGVPPNGLPPGAYPPGGVPYMPGFPMPPMQGAGMPPPGGMMPGMPPYAVAPGMLPVPPGASVPPGGMIPPPPPGMAPVPPVNGGIVRPGMPGMPPPPPPGGAMPPPGTPGAPPMPPPGAPGAPQMPPQQQGGGKQKGGNKGASANGGPAPAAPAPAPAPAPPAENVKPTASAGLRNEPGDNTCFLNVAVQGLYHLRPFRRRLLAADGSAADPAEPSGGVSRALIEVFSAMDAARPSAPGGPASRGVVAPAPLRAALAKCGGDAFKLNAMSDASEVMHVLYESLHRTFRDSKPGSATVANANDDKYDPSSLAHLTLALDVEQYTQCRSCGHVETHLRYAKPFHLVHAQLLRRVCAAAKESRNRDASFGSLLGAIQGIEKEGTDRTCSACGRLNPGSERVHHAPSCLGLVVCWETERAPASDVATVASALGLELELSEVFELSPGACDDGKSTYRLRAVACFGANHYKSFCWQPMSSGSASAEDSDEAAQKPRILTARRETCATLEDGRWMCMDDDVSTLVGDWTHVVGQMKRESLQPLVLFYERC